MKIKNEYVQIKNGKTYDFRNTIMPEYLQLFSKSQYDENFKKKSVDKPFDYVYIKTSEDTAPKVNDNTDYYNLINVQKIKEKTDKFSVDNDDWITFNGVFPIGADMDYIDFEDPKLISVGDSIRILIEVDYDLSEEMILYFSAFYGSAFLHGYEWKENQWGIGGYFKGATSLSNKYSPELHNYLIAIHWNNISKEDYDRLYHFTLCNPNQTEYKKRTFKFRISYIKEENTRTEFFYIPYNEKNYKYNTYIDFNNLALSYDYRLPIVQKYYNSNNSRIDAFYNYDNMSGYHKSDGEKYIATTDINEMANKKINKLGFGTVDKIYAFVDISGANIIVEPDTGVFIYRKDIITSDAIFVGQNLIPAHLCPLGFAHADGNNYYAELYSVGLGFSRGDMNEEYLISQNPIEQVDDTTFRVTLEKGIDDTLTPYLTLQPRTTLYPVLEAHIANGVYPNINLQPLTDIYPRQGSYKYIIYKYRLYKTDGETVTTKNEFYTMSFYTEHKGTTRVNTKFERR